MAAKIDTFLALIAAWKRKDIDAVLEFMDDEIVWHFAAGAEPPLKGKTQARKFLSRFGAGMGEIRWRVFHHAESGDRLFVEGVDEFDTLDGKVVIAPYAGVIDFKDGRIVGWRDYVDLGVMTAQQAGQPITAQVKDLSSLPAIA